MSNDIVSCTYGGSKLKSADQPLYIIDFLLPLFTIHLRCIILYYVNLSHISMSCSNVNDTLSSAFWLIAFQSISHIIGPIYISINFSTWCPIMEFTQGRSKMSRHVVITLLKIPISMVEMLA